MTLNNIIAGIQILQPYYTDPNGYHMGAEHDEIYLYPTARAMLPADVEKMVKLGWTQEGGANVENPDQYDVNASWRTFV